MSPQRPVVGESDMIGEVVGADFDYEDGRIVLRVAVPDDVVVRHCFVQMLGGDPTEAAS